MRPVTLPTDCDDDLDEESAIAIGNGGTLKPRENSFYKDLRLQQVTLEIIPQELCDQVKHSTVDGDILCANSMNQQGVYKGDSGERRFFFSIFKENKRRYPINLVGPFNPWSYPIQ